MDWSLEYSEATRLMGLRGTDLGALAKSVSVAFVRCPPEWSEGFAALLLQIERRRLFMTLNPPPF